MWCTAEIMFIMTWPENEAVINCVTQSNFPCGLFSFYSGREAPSIKMSSVCFLYYYFGGVDFRSYADWLACRQYVNNVIWRRTKCGPDKWALLCSTWLCGLFVKTLISRTNAYGSCSRPTLNFIECFVLRRSAPTAKPLLLFWNKVSFCRVFLLSSLSVVWVPWKL